MANKKHKVEELEKTMEDQNFWDDAKESAKVIGGLSLVGSGIYLYNKKEK